MASEQRGFLKGIYQFEDPTGQLLAAKIPPTGSADLYDGTVLVVRPNQYAIFIYNGQIADIFPGGSHTLKTENVPILTRLSNWKFGLESPLQCEIWFLSTGQFSALKWGTKAPVVHSFIGADSVALRAFGNYNLAIMDPKLLFSSLMGSRTILHVEDVRDFVQGQIAEVFPAALNDSGVKKLEELGRSQSLVSHQIEEKLASRMEPFGLEVRSVQVEAILPPEEVLKALDEKAAMNVIGDGKAYLLYKAAASLDSGNQISNTGSGQDPLHMMLGLMLGRGVFGNEAPAQQLPEAAAACPNCGAKLTQHFNFCPGCGNKL
jgi:membrane protease subunit (stomatin/prohibitin family)